MADFLNCLTQFDGKPFDNFPRSCPPCDATGNAEIDRVLARGFAQVCSPAFQTEADKMEFLWTRRCDLIGQASRWAMDAPEASADFKRAADIFSSWFEALHANVPGSVA